MRTIVVWYFIEETYSEKAEAEILHIATFDDTATDRDIDVAVGKNHAHTNIRWSEVPFVEYAPQTIRVFTRVQKE